MEGIPLVKRFEVARYYVLGFAYSEIEEKTGVSHGTVVNIIKELDSNELSIPGLPSDQVIVLHQLSLDLKKKGLQPSQALLGVSLFERLKQLGITPSDIDHWSELVKAFSQADFPAKDFFEVALNLRHLEKATGKPFSGLAEEYLSLKEKYDSVSSQIDSLTNTKAALSAEKESASGQVTALKKELNQVKGSVDMESAKLKELKLALAEAVGEKAKLAKEVKELKLRRTQLASEVDGKEESLATLKAIGFTDEDLLRLRNLLEKVAKKKGADTSKIKDDFFLAFACFSDLLKAREVMQAEVKTIEEYVNKKSLLSGEIAELEKAKAVLQGEISESTLSASTQITAASQEAIASIKQEAAAITKEIGALLEDALIAGQAVGAMTTIQQKGEDSATELKHVLHEVKSRLGG